MNLRSLRCFSATCTTTGAGSAADRASRRWGSRRRSPDAGVDGARRFPIDFLPFHQKLDRSLALRSDIPIGLDAGANHALYFVRLLFDFFHGGDQSVFGVGENFVGSSERVEAKLSPLKIERRRYQACGIESLFESEKRSLVRVQVDELH